MDFDSIAKGLEHTGVFIILYLLIRSQLEQLNGMKTQIETMKTYVEMFNVDEFKKYAKIAAENAEDAAFKKFLEAAPELVKEIIKEIKEEGAASPNP